ncbi:zinc finger, CCHC-type containing protein [Tanacetum coccineum]
MRTTVVLVPTRNQSWNVGSVARLVTSKGIVVVVKRTTQMLVVREKGLRTNPKTKVDAIAWWIDYGATTHVYESDKYILSKSGVFVGFRYYNSGMFMLNLNKVLEDSDSVYMSSSTVVNSSLWHARLGHVHYKRMLEMSKDDLIPAIDENPEKLIIHETIAPYTPQQNGVAERKNRALKEMVNSMLSYSGLSEGFWGEAMLTACYLLNRIPNKRNKTTPYELWYKKRPNLSYLRVYGCRAIVRLPDPKRKTLGEKGIDCIFVGYAEHFNAYRFYVIKPNDSVSINSIIESRDAIFEEYRFSSIPIPNDIIPNLDESQRDDHFDDVPSEIPEPRKGKRVRKAKSYGSDFQLYLVEGSRDQVGSQYSYCYSIEEDLRTYDEAIQKEGIDYFDTYAPVARITTIRLLLALAAIHNLVIHQMDVKTTFLNGDLDEEVYMKQPEGFVMPSNEHKVCNSDKNQVDKTKKFLSSRFFMKDMGEADVILGIKIKHENKGNVITQSHYIEKTLKKFNHEDCSPVSTLMDPVEKTKPNMGKHVDQLEYSRATGCLMYAMTSTRPDIAYAVGRLSRFTSNPSRQHWQAITRVFKYLKGTMNYGLLYVGYPSMLKSYLNASWINHVEDSSSTSGWVFLLGGGAISRASKKQTCITSSTMKYEFVALAAAGKEAEWLRNLIHEIPIWPKPIASISIHCDSAATLAKAYSQMYNGKSRHLGVRHSMIRELIMNGVISIEFVRSQHNLADHSTKGLARDLMNKSVIGMGLKSI